MEPRATVEIDVVAGAGVIEVVGDDDASMLLLFGDVAGLGGDDSWGSVALLAARAGPDVVRSGEVKALAQWLAEPGPDVDTIDGRCVPPSPDRLWPLLRLLRPGRYVMTAYIPARPPHLVAKGVTHWYDGAETALIPTDGWPPPDRDTIGRYQARIESGRRFPPALVELSPLLTSPIGYLLDGHHKLAAYQQARRSPLIIRLAPEHPFRPRSEDIDRATKAFTGYAWSSSEADHDKVHSMIAKMSFLAAPRFWDRNHPPTTPA